MTERILLVDDEEDFVETLATRLRNRDMVVDTALSGKKAMALIEKKSFDAVVLDLQMPDMDGLQVLAAIKETNPIIQVILLTGRATVEKGIQAMKLGALDLLEKPADIDDLTDRIKEASEKRMIMITKENEDKIKNILKGKGW
ncbi:MAG: response regulator [Thermodesulfobacteriota bacterium]